MKRIVCLLLLSVILAGCATIGLDSTGPFPTRSPVPSTTQLPTSTAPVPTTTQPIPTTTVTVPPTTVPVPPTTLPIPSTEPKPTVDVSMELTEPLKEELRDLWFTVKGAELHWEATNNIDEPSFQYHGSFNGKHILVTVEDSPPVARAFSLDIGYYELWHGSCPFQVYVCYGGNVITMKEAYDAGLFTDEEAEVIIDYLLTVFPDE